MLAIERDAYPRPWSEQQFLHELQAAYSQVDLLLFQEEIVGYVCFWLAADEMHILNVATAAAWRRRGVGRGLLKHAIASALAVGAERAFLEVRRGNLAACTLYRAFGFVDDGVRPAYYADGEDALLMSCTLREVL